MAEQMTAERAMAELWGALCPDCGPEEYALIVAHVIDAVERVSTEPDCPIVLPLPGPPTVQETINALLLTDFDDFDEAVVAAWTDDQRRQAHKWAWHEHLIAGDNEVERLPRPAFLPPQQLWGQR